jgi:hypothetical protein
MTSLWQCLSRNASGPRRRPASRRPARSRPALECLEGRLTPSGITDMTELAQSLGPPPDQPTHLYLNFDGFQGTYEGQNHDVAAFAGSSSDIQDILFRVSELYAPFNVEVSRLQGQNNYDAGNGSTTVFIGGDGENYNEHILGPYSHAGAYGTDIPSQWHKDHGDGTDHPPHGNPFNVVWVDPTSKVDAQGNQTSDPTQWIDSLDNTQISQAVAHEAGHTFGLAHVDSLGLAEMMSYTGPNTYFRNATWQIDTQDNNGSSLFDDEDVLRPVWDGTPITTQNSFTFLQAMIGSRPDDGVAHVAHAGSVDFLFLVPHTQLTPDAPVDGTLTRPGQFDVYTYTDQDAQDNVFLRATGDNASPDLNLELLIYDSNGNQVFEMTPGQTYSLVVGSSDGVGAGSYELNVLHVPDVPPQVGPVGPEDPVSNGGGTGGPVMTGPGDPLVLNPGGDPWSMDWQWDYARQAFATINAAQGPGPADNVAQTQLNNSVFTLANSDVLGLQQPSQPTWALAGFSNSLAQGPATDLALWSSPALQSGYFFIL